MSFWNITWDEQRQQREALWVLIEEVSGVLLNMFNSDEDKTGITSTFSLHIPTASGPLATLMTFKQNKRDWQDYLVLCGPKIT